MKPHRQLRPFALSLLALLLPLVAPTHFAEAALPEGFTQEKLKVDGVAREFLLYAPASAKESKTPVVFVFHGHGGTMANAARSFAMNAHWPEAISVYMQGLNTPGRLTDPEGKKPGWQGRAGDQDDRDLKFFDAVLAKLRAEYQVDEKRVYATGHSNGGGFTYLLWAERGDLFAAMAPSSAAAARRDGAAAKLKPKPAMHLAGETDPLVKYEWQRAAMETVRALNGCASEGRKWAEHCLIYDSPGGTPFISFIHPGGHQFPEDAPATIAKFFQEFP